MFKPRKRLEDILSREFMRTACRCAFLAFAQALLLAAIALAAFQTPHPVPPRPLELQGDSLGETFAVFMANHPKALCQDVAKTRRDCYQWEEVSIYGLSPRPASDCTPARHARPGCEQGLTAQFYEGYLFMISYAVSGKSKEPAVDFLRKKFSAPVSDTADGTIWAAGNRTLSVVVEKSGGRGDVESIVRFTLKGEEAAAPPNR